MSEESRCVDCGTVFSGRAIQCNICRAATIAGNRAESDRQYYHDVEMAKLQRQEDFLGQLQAMNKKSDDTARANIILQAQVNAETKVTLKQAYDFGFNYIDSALCQHNNSVNLRLAIFESGQCGQKHAPPYISSLLNNEFLEGLYERMRQIPLVSKDTLILEAKKMGRKIAEYPNSAKVFTLQTGLEIKSLQIQTVEFKNNCQMHINKATGEMESRWSPPFKDKQLNDAFLEGINEVIVELNTEELKNDRLAKIVAKNATS